MSSCIMLTSCRDVSFSFYFVIDGVIKVILVWSHEYKCAIPYIMDINYIYVYIFHYIDIMWSYIHRIFHLGRWNYGKSELRNRNSLLRYYVILIILYIYVLYSVYYYYAPCGNIVFQLFMLSTINDDTCLFLIMDKM